MGRPPRDDEELRLTPGFAQALGRTIKVIRTDLGIERRALAEAAGISYSYLTEIENGNKPPSSSVLAPIARALGVRMHQLIEAAEDRSEAGELDLRRPLEGAADSWPASAAAQTDGAQSMASPSPGESRAALERGWAMRPSMRGPSRGVRSALLELERLLPSMPPEDVERILDLARRLAR